MSLYPLMPVTAEPDRLTVRTTQRDEPVAVVLELEDGSLVVRVGAGVTIETLEEST